MSVEMYVARDGDGAIWLYGTEPEFDDGSFVPQEDEAAIHLDPDQASGFADLPPGQCIPVSLSWWRSIESAPKDGFLLLWDGHLAAVGLWNSHLEHWQVDDDWFEKPTHWQPLPPSPAKGESDE